ncbi:MAG TPA: acyl-CoA dehydrogenase family protein [Solirubrobacteraceae bacterium]|nr:acyl-CoA dehydrogenase family protein [Solirubrobacteraceae bacterium]
MDADPRAELERWHAARPANFYDATPNLARSLRVALGDDGLRAIEPGLRAFGEAVAMVVEPAVQALELRPPSLEPADSLGRESQRVTFDPEYARAGRAVCASGIAAAPAFEQAALLYLLAHAGEGGHACPVVCTAGLIRALRRHGSPELQERFLGPLLEPDYDRCHRGAQFLTEVQGGSDVGANRVEAVPEGNVWRISGEKWFCSVADADQFLVTARARGAGAGTRGIGCFLVPRRLPDGTANGFRIRRLKDKLGTRALATGEIEFTGALGHMIGAPEDGFRIAAGVVLNTSRWLNALGSTGLMRRAYLEAASFSRFRTAFGRRIADYPLVRENLAVMKVEEQAALASTLELTALVDAIDTGTADSEDLAWHRILVNANKFVTSLAATSCVRRGIEALGGNGTIEDFSPLPRLYRDAIVFESWEGTHNILCDQVLRDLGRLDALDLVLERVRRRLPPGDGEAAAVAEALDGLAPRLRRSLAEGPLHFRRQLNLLVRALQAACLLADGEAAAAALHVRRHLVSGYDPEADADYADLVDEVIGADLKSG